MGKIFTEVASASRSESVNTSVLSMTLGQYEVEEVTVAEANKLMRVTEHDHSAMLETPAWANEYLRLPYRVIPG